MSLVTNNSTTLDTLNLWFNKTHSSEDKQELLKACFLEYKSESGQNDKTTPGHFQRPQSASDTIKSFKDAVVTEASLKLCCQQSVTHIMVLKHANGIVFVQLLSLKNNVSMIKEAIVSLSCFPRKISKL